MQQSVATTDTLGKVKEALAEKSTDLTAEQEQQRRSDDRTRKVDNGALEEEA